MNREKWLTEAAKQLETRFHNYYFPPYRASCGWPSRCAGNARECRLAECHYPSRHNPYHNIFISPVLSDSILVLETLAHEMVHIVAGSEAKHGDHFQHWCELVGLSINVDKDPLANEELKEEFHRIIRILGPYPHVAMKITPPKKNSINLECANCGCRVRMTIHYYNIYGPPTCSCGRCLAKES